MCVNVQLDAITRIWPKTYSENASSMSVPGIVNTVRALTERKWGDEQNVAGFYDHGRSFRAQETVYRAQLGRLHRPDKNIYTFYSDIGQRERG